jgi:hypothetical protein
MYFSSWSVLNTQIVFAPTVVPYSEANQLSLEIFNSTMDEKLERRSVKGDQVVLQSSSGLSSTLTPAVVSRQSGRLDLLLRQPDGSVPCCGVHLISICHRHISPKNNNLVEL